MFKTKEVLMQLRVESVVLESWVTAGWLVPQRHEQEHRFSEADVARGRLIADLKHDLGVNDEGIGVILDLVDQLHGMRRTMRELVSSLRSRPDQVRREILEDFHARVGPGGGTHVTDVERNARGG